MKRGNIQHIEINVSDLDRSKVFYEELLAWMDYSRILDEEEVVGWGNGDVQVFLVTCEEDFRETGFHRMRVGLNHVAFRAELKEDVDRFYQQFLVPKKVPVLYGGPREYPEYGPSHYAVYFEDPDRIKLEFVHGIDDEAGSTITVLKRFEALRPSWVRIPLRAPPLNSN